MNNPTERDLVRAFLAMERAGHHETLIPMSECDSIVTEMSMKFGRADIVVFHANGAVSVIEAKDGTKGYTHVVSGIGQACLYAIQLAMNGGTVRKVRKCLMWSSTGDTMLDVLITLACENADVVPIPQGSLKDIMSAMAEAATA